MKMQEMSTKEAFWKERAKFLEKTLPETNVTSKVVPEDEPLVRALREEVAEERTQKKTLEEECNRLRSATTLLIDENKMMKESLERALQQLAHRNTQIEELRNEGASPSVEEPALLSVSNDTTVNWKETASLTLELVA